VLLKVGELAKRTGLTIRALHYYDNIGLLKPSGRSESGYRLYNQSDVARLHGIQALRRLGLPLADITRLFEEGTASLPLIISRQIQALEHEMAKAAELRSRLLFVQEQIVAGINPEIEAWLSTLGLMTTYGKYFGTGELRKIVTNWNQLLAEWRPLIAAIRRAMEKNMLVASPEVQTLARRWMDLSLRWMEGDFELLKRWGNMCKEDPAAHGSSGIDAALFQYITVAIDLRLDAFHRYLEPSQVIRMKQVAEDEWTRIGNAAERMMQQGVSTHSTRAKRLAVRWSNLVDRLTDNDPAIREKLLLAIRNEPILQAGMTISASAREFIRGAYRAAVLHTVVPKAKSSSTTA
jgi:DNA-binding transcriptional MerR regulator